MTAQHKSDLQVGVNSPDAGNWQRFLFDHGFTDPGGQKLIVDEKFGSRTAFATRNWQRVHGLTQSGVVTTIDRGLAQAEGYIPFVEARHYTKTAGRTIDVIVFHDAEYPETPEGAEWVANYFAGPNAPKASAHYSVDSNSVVQSVRDRDVAWHAPGANRNGIGIEHAGYAKQSRADWLDKYSSAELAVSAKLVAKLLALYNIPLQRLTPAMLKAGERGICGHKDVTDAFSGGKGHTDPGPNFVWPEYLALVAAESV